MPNTTFRPPPLPIQVERRRGWAHTPAMVRRRQDQRGLTTLLFTDIVGSSQIATELGDRRWKTLQERHHAEVRKQLKRQGGHEVDTAGDGFFATFGSPESGVRCAFAIVQRVRELGLDVRAGLHIGVAELSGEKVSGIAVTTAARVSADAGPGQVLATDTIVHMVAGSGFGFTDLGSRELRGVQGRWDLFSLDAVDGESIGVPLDTSQAIEQRDRASPMEESRRSRGRVLVTALAVLVAVTTSLVLATRGHPSAGTPVSTPSPAVHETVAVLSADDGHLLFRSASGGSTIDSGPQGANGPIVLTGPQGRSGQSFAWEMTGEPVGNGQTIFQLTRTNGDTVDTIPPLFSCNSPPGCMAEADGSVWFLVSDSLSRPDGTYAEGIGLTTRKVAKIPIDRQVVVLNMRALAAGDGALWTANDLTSTVYRLDLQTHHVKRYPVKGSADDLAFGQGFVWVIDTAGSTLTRLDRRGGSRKSITLNQAGTLSSIAVGGGYVWVTDDTADVVWRVSTDMTSVKSFSVGSRPDDVAYEDGSVWVANYDDATVSKVNAIVGSQVAYPVGIRPRALAVDDGQVWVAGNIVGVDIS
jgi:class 3 adenylate cyclase